MNLKIPAAVLLMAFIGFLLKEIGFKGAKLFGAVCCAVLAISFTEGLSDMLFGIRSFADEAGVSDIAAASFKVVLSGYVFGFVADTAEELSEGGIAKGAELAGRIEVLLITLPYFMEILNLGLELLK